jgi:hypothetical protein
MFTACRKFVICSLLTAYGAVALLGHGLHWLSLDERHHHGFHLAHAAPSAESHAHHHHAGSHGHHNHHGTHHQHCSPAADCDRETPFEIAAIDEFNHAHDCDICSFLLQIRSERPQVAAVIVCHSIVAAVPGTVQRSYSPVTLGPHAARGPPLDLA